MGLNRRNFLVYALLSAVWVLVVVWQGEEHFRFRGAAKADLSSRAKDIANTVSACIRGMRFRSGTVPKERLESVLNELVNGRSNELVKASELVAIVLLNSAGSNVVSAGRQLDLTQTDILQEGEHWGQHSVSFVIPVDLGASVLPPINELTNAFPETIGSRPPPPREGEPGSPPPPPELNMPAGAATNAASEINVVRRFGPGRSRGGRPPWLRGLGEKEYQTLMEQGALHGLVVAMSTEAFQAASLRDLWLRGIIILLASVSVVGSSLAWGNLVKSSDLQIRLVRASELNTHLKEMNLAAAGLAHETRNPLNIIRGLAQMLSKPPGTPPEVREKSLEIVGQADKVAAQLNEFINYSRPREVRRSVVALNSVVNEVVRTLNYDVEEKKARVEVRGEPLSVMADEQLLRQALFNLLLNAIQVVDGSGEIQVVTERRNATEAVLEVRDNGPGVPPDRRAEIFKPYFTTQKQGTGLGLAVVQQIVLAHGWEVECVGNQPRGAVFRISHIKVAG
jgi:signal transduction histidine kinase